MKTVIIYASVHHNNTKELVCAIAAENDIDVVDATKITEKHTDSTDAISSKSAIVAYLIFTIIPSLLLLFTFSSYSYITIFCLNTLPEQPS